MLLDMLEMLEKFFYSKVYISSYCPEHQHILASFIFHFHSNCGKVSNFPVSWATDSPGIRLCLWLPYINLLLYADFHCWVFYDDWMNTHLKNGSVDIHLTYKRNLFHIHSFLEDLLIIRTRFLAIGQSLLKVVKRR